MTESAIDTCALIHNFVVRLNDKFQGDYKFSVEYGRKNARIVSEYSNGNGTFSGRSAYCFVRIEDGAILKTASWKTPAKGVRAWIDQVLASDLENVDPYTSWLYR